MMHSSVVEHSINAATEHAVRLWALTSSQYPRRHEPLINAVVVGMLESVSSFALNARRALEVLPPGHKFTFNSPRWDWQPSTNQPVVTDLWEATNRIIHAKALLVGMESMPDHASWITADSVAVPYVQAETDRKELSFIDPFAMAHAFRYQALPALYAARPKNVDLHLRSDRS
jgi:hypothetical protein